MYIKKRNISYPCETYIGSRTLKFNEKDWLFEKINKSNKLLAKLTKRERRAKLIDLEVLKGILQ
jgi:hypothetical protein